jgi:pepF/M3 family oligoendopeptidase
VRRSRAWKTERAAPPAPAPLDEATIDVLETLLARLNAVLQEMGTLQSYIYSFVATNSRDAVAQARLSEFEQHAVRLSQLDTRFTAWLGGIDVEALIARSPVAAGHAFALRKAKQEAAHLMTPGEEDLAAELNVSGGNAWRKLHATVTSQLAVPVELDGQVRELPMSMVRNLAFDADRAVRHRAYQAELAAWQRVEVPLAAALNSIKGEVNTLCRRRGWSSPLDEALFNSNIDRQTLDAMMTAAHAFFPVFRRYLRAKARALGLPALAWYDLFAPLGAWRRPWDYVDATTFIAEQFGTYSPKMRDFALRAFAERWIDAEPRDGKRDGAFCMGLRPGESRVFMNYRPTYDAVSTLAHELGHAYHNLNMRARTPLQRRTPMTLAETASIFCETVINQAALRHASVQEQIAILEGSLQGACQVVVDITSRFLFETRVFEQRRARELSVDELKTLILDAQRQTYGDGLDMTVLHPYMWAVKGHYYSTERSYYNYPYMFGLLFGLGLYALYQQDPEGFKGGYDELLSSTGLADPQTLAARFSIDLRTPAFWQSSLAIVGADVDRFAALTAG